MIRKKEILDRTTVNGETFFRRTYKVSFLHIPIYKSTFLSQRTMDVSAFEFVKKTTVGFLHTDSDRLT
jgi:hypothetical protein